MTIFCKIKNNNLRQLEYYFQLGIEGSGICSGPCNPATGRMDFEDGLMIWNQSEAGNIFQRVHTEINVTLIPSVGWNWTMFSGGRPMSDLQNSVQVFKCRCYLALRI